MTYEMVSSEAIERRNYWVSEIVKISGNFGQDYTRVEAELAAEVTANGYGAILDHLRLAGVIPEGYGHDTSEEKLYSKYTDALLAVAFRSIGLKSIVLTERADAADVEVFAADYAFVADAKAFRLTRTAKNQKDFKVQAMDGWRRDKKYAIVVAPLYQMPASSSQIYEQATTRDVCLLSYSHLAVLVRVAHLYGQQEAQAILTAILESVAAMNPSKDAVSYWKTINEKFTNASADVLRLWREEKIANVESIAIAKEEGLRFFAALRENIMSMSHEEALNQLVSMHKIDRKVRLLDTVTDNHLIEV